MNRLTVLTILAGILYLSACPAPAIAQDNGSADNATGHSQNNDQDQGNTRIDDIIEKSLQAYGNKERLSGFANSVQFIGSIANQNDAWHKHAYKHIRKSPAWRTDVEQELSGTASTNTPQTQASVISTIFDGTNFWQVGQEHKQSRAGQSPPLQIDIIPDENAPPVAPPISRSTDNPQVKSLSPEQSQSLADQAERQPFLLTYWQNPDYHFQLLGETTYKHLPVYAVEITYKNHTPTLIYLDRSNYLVCAIAFQSWQLVNDSDELKKVTVVKEYAENRPALNSIWPFKETVFLDKKPVSIITLSAVSDADDINPDYFRPAYAQGEGSAGGQPRLVAPITVPFEYCQSEIVCRGKIDSMEPLYFLIDTGTSDTIIDRSIAAQCLLPRNGDFRFSSFRGNVQAQTSYLDRLELGNLIINNISAQVADLSSQSKQVGRSIAGIIGMNVLANYLVTIDYARPCLLFADPYTGSRPSELVSIPFVHMPEKNAAESGQPPVPRIKVTLPGADNQTMIVDTGAAFNHLAASVAAKHLKEDVNKVSHSHTIEGTGLDGRPVQLGLITLDPIVIGSYKIHRITFTYPSVVDGRMEAGAEHGATHAAPTDNDVLSNTLGVSGILGNPFFEHFLVTLDCPFHRLLLKANPLFETSSQLDEALSMGDTSLFTKRDFRQAEFAYQKALSLADNTRNVLYQALAQGRLGNLRRMMAHDLRRPEHAQAAYQYFKKADRLATEGGFKEAQGRILADWSLLYSENGQMNEGRQAIEKALLLAPKDPFVNIDYAVHLFREHSYAEAEKYIGKALFFDPQNWQALWYQVKLSEMFHDPVKEKSALQEILQHYPWSKVAQTKLKAIETPTPPSAQ